MFGAADREGSQNAETGMWVGTKYGCACFTACVCHQINEITSNFPSNSRTVGVSYFVYTVQWETLVVENFCESTKKAVGGKNFCEWTQ